MHFQGKAILNTDQMQGEVAGAGQWQLKDAGAHLFQRHQKDQRPDC